MNIWQVDIISISWGMENEVPKIQEAIEKASDSGVVIFACASNDGLNKPITFPASIGEPKVFCIGSADATGTRSRFSPVAKGIPKYSAIGEAVLGAGFSKSDSTPKRVRKDGTSISTPVAAGIAAELIEYTRQFLDPGKDAACFENMRKLFLAMSIQSKGRSYRFLAPWSLFEFDSEVARQEKFREIFNERPSNFQPH